MKKKIIASVISITLILTMSLPETMLASAETGDGAPIDATVSDTVVEPSTVSSDEGTSNVENTSAEEGTPQEEDNSDQSENDQAQTTCTCGTETDIHLEECPLYTAPTINNDEETNGASISEAAQAYLDKINSLMGFLVSLDASADDYQEQLESINAQMSVIAEDATNDFAEGILTEDEYVVIYTALEELNTAIGGAERGEALGTGQLSFTITNADVVYAVFDRSTNVSTLSFTQVSNGDTVTVDTRANNGKGLIFFVKPTAGSLLTDLTLRWSNGSTSRTDLYDIEVPASDSNFSFIKNNSVVGQDILDKAKELGYVGYFGYTLSNNTFSQDLTVKADKPGIQVKAYADPSSGIRPGTEIKYTVVITPDQTNAKDAKIEKASLKEIKINGEDIDVSTLTLITNADGTYTVEIPHTVTTEEWINSLAEISVTAELEYSYSLQLIDQKNYTSDVETKTTVEGSASVQCQFDSKKGILYELRYDAPDNITPPTEKFPTAPTDEGEYWKDAIITVEDYDRTEIDDPVNGGTWKFSGWYVGDDREKQYGVNDQLTMGDSNILLVGIWKFEKYPLVNLTITKSGAAIIDEDQSFIFRIKGIDDNTKNIDIRVVIHGNGEVKIKDLPAGRYRVTEETAWSWRYTPTKNPQEIELNAVENTLPFSNTRTNDKWLNGNAFCDNRWMSGSQDKKN